MHVFVDKMFELSPSFFRLFGKLFRSLVLVVVVHAFVKAVEAIESMVGMGRA